MSNQQPFQKGAKLDKAKLKKEKFFLGQEHGAGVFVFVRGLTTKESEAHLDYVKSLADASKSEFERKNAGYHLMACSVVNEDGSQMFDSPEDVEQNFDISAADFVKLIEVMSKLSGFDKDRSKN